MDRPEKYRTRFDKNTFHNKITCCEMSVFDYHGNIRPEKVLVDKADVPFIKAIKWRVGGNGYVGSSFGYLHNFLLQRDTTDRTIVVDHDNGNPLDCRRNNLKVVSQTYNLLKAKIRKDNTSGEKGVYLYKGNRRTKPWWAYVNFNGKRISIGYFLTKEEAVSAREFYTRGIV